MNYTSFFALLILLFTLSCSSSRQINTASNFSFFVGTSTDTASEGIYAYTLNTETGEVTLKSQTENITNASFLTISPDNRFLYALERKKGATENSVNAYSISKDLSLTLRNQQSTEGNGACYISTSKMGDEVLIAHYTGGSITHLPVQSDGSLAKAATVIQHEGSSINTERQNSPHAHFIRQGFDDLIYAADLGMDKVMLYELEEGKLQAAQPAFLDLPKGAGPRHISFHPNGKFLYVMNELSGSVSLFTFDQKARTFEMQQTISSLPEGFDDFNGSADIHVHPSGKFLYASNRGDHDSIAAYKIDEKTGRLSLIEIEQETIVWPRNFAISPDGKYLLCGNQKDDTISIFKIDSSTGALTFTGQRIEVPKPMCVQFMN
ncbi:MAG: lactonase family protein [Bacteroidota bacterium]